MTARSRRQPRSYVPVEDPRCKAPPFRQLGMLEKYDDGFVVCRVYPGGPVERKRKFIVDSTLEGLRLVYRVHGLRHVEIEPSGDGYMVTLSAVTAGG